MKKFKVCIEILGQPVWTTVEANCKTVAQIRANDRIKSAKKAIKEVIEV